MKITEKYNKDFCIVSLRIEEEFGLCLIGYLITATEEWIAEFFCPSGCNVDILMEFYNFKTGSNILDIPSKKYKDKNTIKLVNNRLVK